MNVAILPYGSSAFEQHHHHHQHHHQHHEQEDNNMMPNQHDVDEMLDVEDIFASVFSSFDAAAENHDDDIVNLFMDEFDSAPVQHQQQLVPKAMMSPAPHSSNGGHHQHQHHHHHFAHLVSPTASSADLVDHQRHHHPHHQNNMNSADDYSCDPTPLSDFRMVMASIPDASSVISADPFQQMNAHTSSLFATQQKEQANKKKRVVSPVQDNTTKAVAKKNSRPAIKKRRVSSTATSSSSSSTSLSAVVFTDKESPDYVELTRQRNREHAKKSRMRKKAFTTCLEHSLADLKAENEKLRAHITKALGGSPQMIESLVEERRQKAASSVENFIASLKKPENRVVEDRSTLEFLRGLRKEAIKPAVEQEIPRDSSKDEDGEFANFFNVVG